MLLLFLLPALSGCGILVHHHTVLKATPPMTVQDATVDQLVQQVNDQFEAVKSFNAAVEIAASVGGSATGEVTDYDPLNGYILLRKPADMRILLLVPVLHTRAIDMVSDGTRFTMLIPPRSRAIEGTEAVTASSKNALENLRPHVFLNSFLPQRIGPEELVSLTSDTHLVVSENKKHATLMPIYELNILRRKGTSSELQTLRVLRLSRDTLLPYQQDIYDDGGRLETTALYDRYKEFDGLQFPTEITIKRPVDGYQVRVTVNKMEMNQEMTDDQFELKIPQGTKVEHLD